AQGGFPPPQDGQLTIISRPPRVAEDIAMRLPAAGFRSDTAKMNSNRAQRALAEAVAAGRSRASARPTGGRGAVSSPAGRFEKLDREPLDDGWYQEDGEPPALRTEVTEERAGRILAFNDSPDLP